MYKPSKFNYFTNDISEGLLLYNSFNDSYAKVTKENKDETISILSSKTIMLNEGNEVKIKALTEKGFLIDEKIDENQKLNMLIAETVNGSELSLTILPTEQCNFRCKYCYEDFKRGKMTDVVQESLVRYVKKNIHKYSALNVSWFGGEPLVAFDVIENLSGKFIEICKKTKRKYSANMVTNGYLLTLDNFRKLLKYKVLAYQLTIDGLKETQDYQKPLVGGGGTFDRVIENLLAIKNNVKTGIFSIMIRTNFTKEIYEQIDEYIDFYHEHFGDDKRFGFFIRPASNFGGDRVKEMYSSFLGDGGILEICDKFVKNDKALALMNNIFLRPGANICYAAHPTKFVIDSEGGVRKCSCNLDDDNYNKIGHLTENGEMGIDADKHSKWFFSFERDKICSQCFLLPTCLQNNCPEKRIIHNIQENICPYEKTLVDYTLQLYSKTEPFDMIY
ncbi:MAG: radical SAM protein [Lachnospiraceae bacterium]|nr:radical SAM protein [Lachnospiraceae bacterium]